VRLMKYLGFKEKSAQTAKNRLQIIIAQQRAGQNSPDYLPLLREDIIKVITKYTNVDHSQIKIDWQTVNDHAVLELNVSLPNEP
jgi:cell division topological specificity factor